MKRIVEPELLDALPATDSRAERSREDLRRVNSLMGHAGIMAALWQNAGVPTSPCSLVELGAGDGTFSLRLVRRICPRWKMETVTLVDQSDAVSAQTQAGFREAGIEVNVICQDVFDCLQAAPHATVMIANLFLHHFAEDELRRLLALASRRTNHFLVCEPRRGALGLLGSHLLGMVGCSEVTRHDAIISVRAGFAGRELSMLWPAEGWDTAEKSAGLFSHSFAARRRI